MVTEASALRAVEAATTGGGSGGTIMVTEASALRAVEAATTGGGSGVTIMVTKLSALRAVEAVMAGGGGTAAIAVVWVGPAGGGGLTEAGVAVGLTGSGRNDGGSGGSRFPAVFDGTGFAVSFVLVSRG